MCENLSIRRIDAPDISSFFNIVQIYLIDEKISIDRENIILSREGEYL